MVIWKHVQNLQASDSRPHQILISSLLACLMDLMLVSTHKRATQFLKIIISLFLISISASVCLPILPDYSVSLESFNIVSLRPQQIITVPDITKPQSHNYLQGRQLHFSHFGKWAN